MNVTFGCAVLTLVAVGLCMAVGLSIDTAPLCREFSSQVDATPAAAWIERSADLISRIQKWIPVRLHGASYAVLTGLRLYAWAPVIPVLGIALAWSLARGLGRRAEEGRIPSPAVAFLVKRGACAAFFLGITAVFAPLSVPIWFIYGPAIGLTACVWAYVSNLPPRL